MKNYYYGMLIQRLRKLHYRFLSDKDIVSGRPIINQPSLFLGKGQIIFHGKVNLGFYPSPNYYNGYIHMEARKSNSKIEIGNDTWINNNCAFISEGDGIKIGDRALIGVNVQIYDSDFHDLGSLTRRGGAPRTGKVIIEENVFVGNYARILKGVRIGKNSIIGAASVVAKSIPENVVAVGNPCNVVRSLIPRAGAVGAANQIAEGI